MVPEKELFHKFQTAIECVKETDQESFLPELSEILEKQEFQPTINAIKNFATKKEPSNKALLQQEQELFQELLSIQEKIETCGAERSINLPQSFIGEDFGMSEFRIYEKGLIIGSNDVTHNCIQAIKNELNFIMCVEAAKLKEKIKAMANKLAIVSEDGQVIRLRDTSDKGLKNASRKVEGIIRKHKILVPHLQNVLQSCLIIAIIRELNFITSIKIDGFDVFIKKIAITTKYGQVLRLRDTSDKGLKKTSLKIKNYTNNHKALDPHQQKRLLHFRERTRKDLIHRKTIKTLALLQDPDIRSSRHKDFVEQFAVVDNLGIIMALKLDPKIQAWIDEKTRFERIKKHSLWERLQRLEKAHQVFKNFETLKQDASAKGDIFGHWQLCQDFEKLSNLEHITVLKSDLKKVAQNFEDPLIKKNSPIKRPKKPSYALETNVLKVKGTDIPFANAYIKQSVLKGVFGQKAKTCSFEKIHVIINPLKKLGEIFLEKADKDQIYNAVRDINIDVHTATGIHDFLIITGTKVAINPLHSK